jgi:hypothetical protein
VQTVEKKDRNVAAARQNTSAYATACGSKVGGLFVRPLVQDGEWPGDKYSDIEDGTRRRRMRNS